MLRLYQSQRLETLVDALIANYRPPSSALQPDEFIVQSLGIGRWLTLRLATRLGICANIRFSLPASYVWNLCCGVFGEVPERSPFAANVLALRIMRWLSDSSNLAQAPRLAAYLGDGDELRRFQLAERIAGVFDQYLVYRDDWLGAWESNLALGLGEDEAWQAELWRHLAPWPGSAPGGRWMRALTERLQTAPDGEIRHLQPERLTLFGISALPPILLDVVTALAARTDVAIYALNPSREYWGEIRDLREIGKLAGQRPARELYLEVGHPLLASLGKQGRDFFDALSDAAAPVDLFDPRPVRGTLLAVLQSDILELADRKQTGPLAIPADDDSLQIHICHSPMREVEVLRDQLLALFERHPYLEPSDVAVLAPDIDDYAPCIEAVFGEADGADAIAFDIADRAPRQEAALANTLLALLELPESRFEADAVIALLEQPAVMRRFRIDATEMPQIHAWIKATATRWGRDGPHKKTLGLPETSGNTWRDALTRLLLGYSLPEAMANGALPLFEGALPHDDVEGSSAELLGRFADFLETLFLWSDRLKINRNVETWAEELNQLIEAVFDPSSDDEPALLQIRSVIANLTDAAALAEFGSPLDIRTVRHWLASRLGQASAAAGFLTGGVTFCSLVPMRSIPFQVIAVLGLNHDKFPRHRPTVGFDLMSCHPRRGDRSRRGDDRYLFLETLLSARRVLYLSYVGRDVRDNSVIPPSPLVSELLDVAAHSAAVPDGGLEQRLITEHPLQPFSPLYFKGNRRLPAYSCNWLEAARAVRAVSPEVRPLFTELLSEPEPALLIVDPGDLNYFFSNPARYLLKRRLRIDLEGGHECLPVQEPFALDFTGRDSLREGIFARIKRGQDTEDTLRWARAAGILPHGTYGTAVYAKEQALVETLAPLLLDDANAEPAPPVPVEFAAHGITLRGNLLGVSSLGFAWCGFARPTPRQLFQFWIQHVLLCIAAPAGMTKQSVIRNPDACVTFYELNDAETILENLLRAYSEGLRYPLPFFTKTSHRYATCRRKSPSGGDGVGDPRPALRDAMAIWNGSAFQAGERENAYYQAAYRGVCPLDGEFERWALSLLDPMLDSISR